MNYSNINLLMAIYLWPFIVAMRHYREYLEVIVNLYVKYARGAHNSRSSNISRLYCLQGFFQRHAYFL